MECTNNDVIRKYFPVHMEAAPFQDADEEWHAWERFMDMLCMLRLLEKEGEQPASLERVGCLLNDMTLVHALEPHERSEFPERKTVRSIFNSLLQRGSMQQQDLPLPLWQFFQTGILSCPEIIAFLMAVCVDRNRKYERIFGVLQEDANAFAKPTVGLACDLCSLLCELQERVMAVLLDEDSFLNRFLLETPELDSRQSRLSKPLCLHRRVLSVLLGVPKQQGCLSVCTEIRMHCQRNWNWMAVFIIWI